MGIKELMLFQKRKLKKRRKNEFWRRIIRRSTNNYTISSTYAAAQPALNQIISEAGQLYNQGVGAAGYVAPTQQTLTGLAQQEQLGTAANQQLAATLGGQYLNPFLSPLIQRTAADISTNVAQQFSGAGRTPGSPMSQQQAIAQVAQAALPLAFGEYGNERQRQLGIATRTPNLIQTGQQLEQLQRQQNLAPAQALQQYAGLVSPIASGFPVTSGGVNTCLLYTSPSPRDRTRSRMPSSA